MSVSYLTSRFCFIVMPSAAEASALSAMLTLQTIAKVTPVGIGLSNQFQFLIPPPVFDLFFSFNSRKGIVERFNINQRIHLVTVGKTFNQSGFVFPDSSLNIIGYPDI